MTQGHRDNRLLAAMPAETLASLERDLRQISLEQGAVLFEPGAPMDDIYFPQTGVVSLFIVTKNGGAIEASTIGREGAIGLHGAIGPRQSFTRAIAQIGGRFSTVSATRFAQVANGSTPIRELIARYTEVLWAEAQQLAACNAMHGASRRLCRWLLQHADRSDSDKLPLTQELLAQMLGVRRTTVTLLAQSMQTKGIIRYRRGHILILDRRQLEECACECYQVIQHERLPFTLGAKL